MESSIALNLPAFENTGDAEKETQVIILSRLADGLLDPKTAAHDTTQIAVEETLAALDLSPGEWKVYDRIVEVELWEITHKNGYGGLRQSLWDLMILAYQAIANSFGFNSGVVSVNDGLEEMRRSKNCLFVYFRAPTTAFFSTIA
ncbi:unnamed protein product [Clonostachys rosea]|uniref:Uncharacterized protein n=1 Tax=Bionectria ochroleuca TaxID=29856 RepID=A0ABY6UEQ5_BIOOC|nr:unnamed protein product [Clonostachys rosea]